MLVCGILPRVLSGVFISSVLLSIFHEPPSQESSNLNGAYLLGPGLLFVCADLSTMAQIEDKAQILSSWFHDVLKMKALPNKLHIISALRFWLLSSPYDCYCYLLLLVIRSAITIHMSYGLNS